MRRVRPLRLAAFASRRQPSEPSLAAAATDPVGRNGAQGGQPRHPTAPLPDTRLLHPRLLYTRLRHLEAGRPGHAPISRSLARRVFRAACFFYAAFALHAATIGLTPRTGAEPSTGRGRAVVSSASRQGTVAPVRSAGLLEPLLDRWIGGQAP